MIRHQRSLQDQSKQICSFDSTKPADQLYLAEQYYSKSEQKVQKNGDDELGEEGVTQKYHDVYLDFE